MPDLYSKISEVDTEIQMRLAEVIEMRAANPQMQAILHTYLSEIIFPDDAKVIEIGCGTGAVTRTIAKLPAVSMAVGIDPSTVFINKSKHLSKGIKNIHFEEGDGRSLKFDDQSFDVVVMHTTMSHVPQPELLLKEAFRVLRRNGWLAVCDGDYSTATVATGYNDPLEECINAFRESYVNDPWLVRRLPQLVRNAGFEIMPMRSYGYMESLDGGYMLTWIDRGADVLKSIGRISAETAEAFKAEAKHRSISKTWFGHIAFASILGRKPA